MTTLAFAPTSAAPGGERRQVAEVFRIGLLRIREERGRELLRDAEARRALQRVLEDIVLGGFEGLHHRARDARIVADVPHRHLADGDIEAWNPFGENLDRLVAIPARVL